MPIEFRRVARALISVYDKTGLIDLARGLTALGVELISTGGTRKELVAAGFKVLDVADLTGFPEMMDGRVKTLHPVVHGGLLAIREDPEHEAAMLAHGISPIDLLVVNLYPFLATVEAGADFDQCVEEIDIGGPAMIRGASKNFNDVAVIVDVEDYGPLLAELEANGGATTLGLRQRLALKAFARTAVYDATISNWLAEQIGEDAPPAFRAIGGRLAQTLRYGENPHQKAGLYLTPGRRYGVTRARQLQGKELSYNNIGDTDAAFELVAEFDPERTAAVAIIKHSNPCGVAEAPSLEAAYALALRCDPVSAFGGVVALNRRLDARAATEIMKIFTEVIIAPDADEDAIAIVGGKKNLRLLLTGGLPDPRAGGLTLRPVAGGLLVQTRDNAVVDDMPMRVVTKREPTDGEWRDLEFAFRVVKHVKSNAIVFAKDGATVGIGAGQMSRIDSTRIAAKKAANAAEAAGAPQSLAVGSVVASDAFLPFPDSVLAAVEAGATAVIQPGGSVRDEEVIAAADAAGVAMAFTGIRHFRH